MDRLKTYKIAKKYINDEHSLMKFVVGTYVRANGLSVKSGVLRKYVDAESKTLHKDIESIDEDFYLEDVIDVFGKTVSRQEKLTAGVIYTPSYIREYIVKVMLDTTKVELCECLCADISCGCGAFLLTLMIEIHKRTNMKCSSILRHLWGIDISANAISRAKVLLALAALKLGENIMEEDFNLYCCDSLKLGSRQVMYQMTPTKGFDIIVGNPPYVTSKHLGEKGKEYLSLWKTCRSGKTDLYIPFFEIGMSLLSQNGALGYITVNSFFKSANARYLRSYLSESRVSMRIADFGQQQVFKNCLTYTCLTFLKEEKSQYIGYAKASLDQIRACEKLTYDNIDYDSLDDDGGWNLAGTDDMRNIGKIEGTGEKLGDRYVIRNGIATCANDIFIFKPVHSEPEYYFLSKDGREYMIEKDICRDIIKPNKLRTEDDIPRMMEKIIFPYTEDGKVIKEHTFRARYPCAYAYLSTFKDRLHWRDKGKREYEAWYAYGRTQNILAFGKRLMFPTISDKPRFVFSSQTDLLLYNGNAVYAEDEEELLLLKRVLESSVFDYYIRHTSKPYSSGYFGYGKAYVRNFGIYPFNGEQKELLLSCKSQKEADGFLERLYGINI